MLTWTRGRRDIVLGGCGGAWRGNVGLVQHVDAAAEFRGSSDLSIHESLSFPNLGKVWRTRRYSSSRKPAGSIRRPYPIHLE